MQALPDRTEFVTVTIIARTPGVLWTDRDTIDADPVALVAGLNPGDVQFGIVQCGITDAAIDAGADPATLPRHP
ncbi:hypothetical protein ACQSSU_20340 [Micromonospora echinospora]